MSSITVSSPERLSWKQEDAIDNLVTRAGGSFVVIPEGRSFSIRLNVDPSEVGGTKVANKIVNSLRNDVQEILLYG